MLHHNGEDSVAVRAWVEAAGRQLAKASHCKARATADLREETRFMWVLLVVRCCLPLAKRR
jgi:hypothetical protein